ncbi:MAG: hypothetical protein JWN44_389 [Myxococcales bacterium]|nr:hypothetical protein [Myxococcales bacterium]
MEIGDRMDGELEEVRKRLSGVADPVALLVGLVAHSPIGFQLYRGDGRCLFTNRAFREIFGAEPPPEYNVLGDPQLAREGILELTHRAFAGESFTTPPVWYDARQEATTKGAGRRCAVTCTGFPLLDAEGRVAHVALMFKEVTAELTLRQDALTERDLARQTQRQLQALLDHAPVVVFVKDLEGRHLVVSREALRAFGIDPDKAYGKRAHELFGSPYAEVSSEHERRALERREPVQAIEPLPTLSGVRDFLVTRFPILDAGGRPTALAGIAIDISERRQAEELLRKSEQRFSQVFRALPMAALLSRMSDKRFLDVNEAWERLTGFSRAEQVGRTSLDLGLWQDIAQRDQLFAALDARGLVRDFTAKMRVKSGEVRETLLSVDRIEVGGEDSVLLIAHDVTDLRRLESELRQSQKMEAVGRLAGGLAHDFNNILTAIGGADTLLLELLDIADPMRRYAEQIQRSTRRAAALTQQLLTFTRKQALEPVVLDPNDAVRATADMLQRMIGADVELRVQLDARGRVKADPGSLEQVIMNLAINARDAMPSGGKLTLCTSDVAGGDGLPARDWVLLAVADSGVGMDAHTRAHLFEPFFTTKEQGKGTGLGLSTVYGIVEQCRGHIFVDSEPGRGSEFRVYLPREHEACTAEAPPSPNAALPGGSETILLAEDDESVREFVSLVLGRLGYRVLEARDGADALTIANRFDGPIDLLLSDVVMPRMDGVELARRLADTRPSMKVVHMSGYPGDARSGDGTPFLGKPFDRDGLARRVRHVLDDAEKRS